MPSRFKRRPQRVDAEQFTPDNGITLAFWCGGRYSESASSPTTDSMLIQIATFEGIKSAQLTDWIVKGTTGEFYIEKDEVFIANYEEVISG